MKKILLFSGTTEGRELSAVLASNGVPTDVCVATEYGRETMEEEASLPEITVLTGRLDRAAMADRMRTGGYACVVDATHPYAAAVSAEIAAAAEETGLPRIRYARDTESTAADALRGGSGTAAAECRCAEDVRAAAAFLSEKEGTVLVTTGSKEIGAFMETLRQNSPPGTAESRVYARVLPTADSIALCRQAGLENSHILAMQGPFSEEMNTAMLHLTKAEWLVSKETGTAGGFPEKIRAARSCGCGIVLIGSPETEKSIGKQEVLHRIGELLGITLSDPAAGSRAEDGVKTVQEITLIGTGMGSEALMTEEALEAIRRADMLFGAPRLLEGISETVGHGRPGLPYYTADRILPWLHEHPSVTRTAVLFSGDTGFCSGMSSLREQIEREIRNGSSFVCRVCPGISSISCLAARCGTSWQDAALLSVHGRDPAMLSTTVMDAVRHTEKTFLLISGAEDIRILGQRLAETGISGLRVTVAGRLSYPDEQIRTFAPEELLTEDFRSAGLCTLLIVNPYPAVRSLAPGVPDTEFIRGKVPMTKQEVREISLCRLHLSEQAVVVDVGSGTGSVSVECARLSPSVRVYAVERKEEALSLLRQNMEKFRLYNIVPVQAEAPDGLGPDTIPEQPTHAFIGGSGGHLREILRKLYERNPQMRVVINAVTLETIAEITAVLGEYPDAVPEIVQIQASRAQTAGRYHLMRADDPVYIVSFDFSPKSR